MPISRRTLIRSGLFALGGLAVPSCRRRARAGGTYLAKCERIALVPEGSAAVFIDGYGNTAAPGVFTGIADPTRPIPSARALALQSVRGGERVVLVSLDIAGISPAMHRQIVLSVADVLPSANLALACSHTHAGPLAYLAMGRVKWPALAVNATAQEQIADYERDLTLRLAALIRRVLRDFERDSIEVSLHHGSGELAGARHRILTQFDTVTYHEGHPARSGETRPYTPPPPDLSVPVLVVVPTRGSAPPLAIVFGYTCHPLVSLCPFGGSRCDGTWEQELHSDYPGIAASIIESTHVGTTALFVQGCAGDQQFGDDFTGTNSRALIDGRGRGLASEVLRVAAEVTDPARRDASALNGRITAVQHREPLPYDLGRALFQRHDDGSVRPGFTVDGPALREIYRRLSTETSHPHLRQHALRLLALGPALPVQQPWRFLTWFFDGDAPFFFFGLEGEVVSEYGRAIREHFAANARTWVAGYVNTVDSYVPTDRVLESPGLSPTRDLFASVTGGAGGDMMIYTAGWDWTDKWRSAGFAPTLYRPAGALFGVDVRTVVSGGAAVFYGQTCRYQLGVENRIIGAVRAIGDSLVALRESFTG